MNLPTRPEDPKSLGAALKGPLRIHWINAMKHQYSKNAQRMLLSKPIGQSKIHPDARTFQSVIATKVKEKGENMWKLEARHCLHGAKMQQGVDFDYSYSPTVSAPCIRVFLAICSSRGLVIFVLDVVNCFQNTMSPEEERRYVTLPPFYMEWFEENYPEVEIEKDESGMYFKH